MLMHLLLTVFCRSALCDSGKAVQDLLTPYREYGETCGYESCPITKPGTLNVHIVPHTHAELGYTHNFHQHYTGEDDMYMPNQLNMERILDFVLTELWSRPNRKFTLSDTTYLFHWWAKRDVTVHRMVYELIRQGRLVLVGTGLTSDESAASYQAVIDQATTSLRKINATFMQCGRPLVAWQAEAFGHSREFASLVAQMGFDGLFIHPISYDEEISRMRRKALEFVWRGSDDVGAESDIFTHKLFDGYWSPPGFCFGRLCGDPRLVTSDSVFTNVQDRVDAFIKMVLYRQSPNYGTRNIMVMMGHRFAYFDASTWFVNIEKLIDFVNQKSVEQGLNVTVFYSNPNCYLQAVHDANPVLETKQDDFFPFVYDKDSYAVGMYTSRPTLKYIVREGYVYLQIAKQLQVTANLGSNDNFFGEFSWITGVMLDHSILTGALRIPVKHYYVAKMHAAITKSTRLVSVAIRKIRNSPEYIQYHRCLFNISSCNQTLSMKYTLQIYNPLGWPVTVPVRLPIKGNTANYTVYEKGLPLKSVIVPIPYPITMIKGRPNADHEIVFIAADLPPLGYRTFYVEGTNFRPKRRTKKVKAVKRKYKRPIPIYNISRINPIRFDDEKVQNENYDFESAENFKAVNTSKEYVKDDQKVDIDYEYDMFKSTAAPIDDIYVHRVRKEQKNASLEKRQICEESVFQPVVNTTLSPATRPTTTREVSINILRTTTVAKTPVSFITEKYKTTKVLHPVRTTANAPPIRTTFTTTSIRKETVPGKKFRTKDGGGLNAVIKVKTKDEGNLNGDKKFKTKDLGNPNTDKKFETKVGDDVNRDKKFKTKDLGDLNTDKKLKTKVGGDLNGDKNFRTKDGVDLNTDKKFTTKDGSDLNTDKKFKKKDGGDLNTDKKFKTKDGGDLNTDKTFKTKDEDDLNTEKMFKMKVGGDLNGEKRFKPKDGGDLNTDKKVKTKDLDNLNADKKLKTKDEFGLNADKKFKTKDEFDLNADKKFKTKDAGDLSTDKKFKTKDGGDLNTDKKFTTKDGSDLNTDKKFETEDLYIANKYVRLNLNSKKRIVGIYLCNGVNMSLDIQMYYYVSDDPKKLDRPEVRQPGVYVFRPIDPNIIRMDEKYEAKVIKTDIVEEIHITFNEWAFLFIRLYKDTPYVELKWLVGPIPIDDELGKDVFIKYSTDLANEGVFYTDSSGRQTIKRIRDRRATYEPVDMHPVAGNLYPVTSKIYIEDLKKNVRFTVFNDRCQAGGSLKEGAIDFMVHRRLLTDDIGIRAWLNETELEDGIRVIGTHYLYVTKADYRKNRIFEKKFAKEVEMPPQVLVSARDTIRRVKGTDYKYSDEFSALKKKFPIGIHLMTLEKIPEGLLIRLENYLEKSDTLKTGVKTVFLNDIFANITILSLRETALAANVYKDQLFNYEWSKKNKFYSNFNDNYGISGNNTYDDNAKVLFETGNLLRGIKLAPQQIRTFIAQYKFNA